MEAKPRILYLLKILLERTDEEHPLSTTQLIGILNEEYGISAHRTTITKDIAALVEYGLDIVTIHSTQSKYFVASRKFELPELKLLIDAVESSKFITKKKSETLIEKIHTMTSPGQVAKLKRNNYVVNRIKPDNEQIYYIIDAINEAINAGKQISFQYYDYTGLKKKVLKNKGEIYKLNPYKLLWCGDYYYVLGYSEKKSKVINFRVDRIASKPEILDKDIIPMPDDFDIENYTKEVFFMFSGEKVLVDLRCDNSLMKTMVDRFGEDVTTLAYDMTSFRVQTEVSASPTFFGWVFGFNGKVQCGNTTELCRRSCTAGQGGVGGGHNLSIYMSRAELEEISEGLITAYANKFSNRVIQSIDIEHFITEFLMLRIEYAFFAEDDAGRIGFLADGATPLLIHQDGKIIPFVFPKDTIVLDKFLLAEKEQGRRRFTMAHEASHHILSKMYAMPSEGRFHAEYDSERSYSKEELAQMFASVEWQADTMGASLLMPRRIIENALAKYNQSNPIRVYGDNTITSKDKAVIRRMAAYIGVSYTALVIRLRDMGLFEYHNILEYISNELNLGGVSQ